MADPSTYRPKTSEIPTDPGVYRFRDEQGAVIYVGKAKNLRARLTNYFQDLANLHPRTQKMVTTAASVQWTVVGNEVEALTLEFTWIKEFNPRFNVMFKDDKSYPYLAVSMGERFPRVQVTREARRKDTRYFGPYTKVWAIRDTIELLIRVFPVRTCSAGVFRRAQAQGRPCLLGYIDKCSAPCVGRISQSEHRALAQSMCDFLEGKASPILRQVESEMRRASAELDFETAAKKRDDLRALETELMARLFEQIYSELPDVPEGRKRRIEQAQAVSVDDVIHTPTRAVPREILVSVMPTEKGTIAEWLSEKRGAVVDIHVPKRGPKAQLMETVKENAKQALLLHKTRRSGDLAQRGQALDELAEYLDLPASPLRIECYDISHTQGQLQVGSMVVFEDGVPRKDAYRHFNIHGENGEGTPDDTSAMDEVLRRRFRRLLAEENGEDGEDEEGIAFESGPVDANGRPRRFSYRPDLVVVDGGLPQVNAARDALESMGIDIPLIGLAKRLEEVWIPGEEFPLIFPRTSAALYMLQYLRDESHRFAITAHRKRRAKNQQRSVLDGIAGVGPSRQKALLRHFGSVKKIRESTPEQIAEVNGIGPSLGSVIWQALNPDSPLSS